MSNKFIMPLLLMIVFLAYSSNTIADNFQSIIEEQTILDLRNAGISGIKYEMGSHIATDQNRIAISSPKSGDVLVYDYDGNNWNLSSAFNATTPYFDEFNNTLYSSISSIALNGNRIVVGNIGNPFGVSEVLIFELENLVWVQKSIITASDAQNNNLFGNNVALNDDHLLIGSPKNNEYGNYAGAVYYYHLENESWIKKQKFVASDTGVGDQFGYALAISNTTLLIGSPYNNYNASKTGAAYVFEFDGMEFIENQKLLGNSSAVDSEFGFSVSINNSQAIIGATQGFNALFVRTGSAYIFEKPVSEWLMKDKVFAGQEGSLFGHSVFISQDHVVIGAVGSSIASSGAFVFAKNNNDWLFDQWLEEENVISVAHSQDTVLVGLPKYDGQYQDQGKVEVYKNAGSNWSSSHQLTAIADGLDGDRFGSSHSVLIDTILIGVPGDKLNAESVGSARIYQKNINSWNEIEKLYASDGMNGDEFGEKVILKENQAFVSAIKQDEQANDAGAVYVFNKTGMLWVESQKLMASDGLTDDAFGSEIQITGDTLFVSSNIDSPNSKVYVFKFNGNIWIEQTVLQSGQANDNFGQSIAIDNDRVFIGAPGDDKVHIYINDNGNWVFQQAISMPTGDYGSEFGVTLAYFNGQLIVLSRKLDGILGTLSLDVYLHLFDENTNVWTNVISHEYYTGIYVGGVPKFDIDFENSHIALSVHVFTDILIYSANTYFFEINNQAIVFLRKYSQFIQQSTNAKMPVTIQNDIAYVGNSSDTINGVDAGAIRVFNLDPPDSIFLNGFE